MEGRTAHRSPQGVSPLRLGTYALLIAMVTGVALTAGLTIVVHELVDAGAPSQTAVAAAAGGAGGSGAGGAAGAGGRREDSRARQPAGQPAGKVPSAAALRGAWSYARARGGKVSFAVVDTEGRLRGRELRRGFAAASVVKAMLLVAEVRRRERTRLDPETEALLRSMITYSDNDAADTIYSRVGDAGLVAVARQAGMTGFTVAGHWGNAEITAADMARLFFDLDRLLAGPHRDAALGLLGSVIDEQSWGIPAAARPAWSVRFKGGWRPTDTGELVHQAAELRDGARKLSIAVLTDGQPTHEFGVETVRGIAERLLSPPARRPGADAR